MDNFDFAEIFRYIGVDSRNDVEWDEGYIDEPTKFQRDFLKEQTKKLRKNKLKNINNEEEQWYGQKVYR